MAVHSYSNRCGSGMVKVSFPVVADSAELLRGMCLQSPEIALVQEKVAISSASAASCSST